MTAKMNRLVDPVHFFNSEGVPVLTLKHLLATNEKLEAELELTKRMLRAQVERNRAIGAEIETPKN